MKTLLLSLTLIASVCCVQAFAEDTRHELERALGYDNSLLVCNDLQLNARQLQELQQCANTAQQALTDYDQNHAAAVQQAAPLLKQEIAALAAGTELAPDVAQGLQDMRDKEQARHDLMMTTIDGQIRQLRLTLMPAQASLVNWSQPSGAMAAPDPAAEIEELRLLAGRLSEAQRMIERIRYLIVSDYASSRVAKVGDYVRAYISPGTKEYNDACEWILKLVGEARLVEDDQWPQQAPVFASQVLQRMGLLDVGPGVNNQAKYNWWDMYDLLTDPQTPKLVKNILGAQ